MRVASVHATDALKALVIMLTLMRYVKCHVHYSWEAAEQTTVCDNSLYVFWFRHKACFINIFTWGKVSWNQFTHNISHIIWLKCTNISKVERVFFLLPFVFRTKLSNVSGSLLGSDKHVVKQVFVCECNMPFECHKWLRFFFLPITLLYTCVCLTLMEFNSY